MLLENSFTVFSLSFLLSFFATLGIILYHSQIESKIMNQIKKIIRWNCVFSYNTTIKKVVLFFISKIVNILAITISVQVLILPICIYYFHSFSIATIFSSMIFALLGVLQNIFGMSLLLFLYLPFVSSILFQINYLLLHTMLSLVYYFGKFSFLQVAVASPSILVLFCYYMLLVIGKNQKYIPKFVSKKRKYIVKLSIEILVNIMLLYSTISYFRDTKLRNTLYYFNVEQGNMSLIQIHGKNIVIDIGSTNKKLAYQTLENYLKQQNITKIDYVILTHYHEDHVNGILSLMEHFPIKAIVVASQQGKEISKWEERIEKIRIEKNVAKISCQIGDILQLKEIEITMLSPPEKRIQAKDILNANSLVLLVRIQRKNFLWMGDATVETEYTMLDEISKFSPSEKADKINQQLQNLTAIQIGHHGSKTSTSLIFLEKISVKEAIISAKKKQFGHPHQETIEKLKSKHISIFETEKQGARKFSF